MKLFKVLLFFFVFMTVCACGSNSTAKYDGINLFQTKEVYPSVDIDGIECKIIEEYKPIARITTSKKLNVEQIKKAKKDIKVSDDIKIFQFFLNEKSNIGQEYAAIDSTSLFLYDANIIIDLKTNTFVDLNK